MLEFQIFPTRTLTLVNRTSWSLKLLNLYYQILIFFSSGGMSVWYQSGPLALIFSVYFLNAFMFLLLSYRVSMQLSDNYLSSLSYTLFNPDFSNSCNIILVRVCPFIRMLFQAISSEHLAVVSVNPIYHL